LGHGISPVTPGLNFWWQIGWIPVATLPLAWYVIILWYSGFWDHKNRTESSGSRLVQRHTPWFYLTLFVGLLLNGLLLFANPLPSFSQLAAYELVASPLVGDIPLLILVYPVYIFLCIGLSVDVLRFPAPSGRLMGDLARARARSWLIATSLILLLVSLLVGWVMVWVVRSAQRDIFAVGTIEIIGRFDLLIEVLIAIAILWLGQAVVTYEVFTGKTLPRRGLLHFWRSAVVLAVGYSLIVAWSITIQLRPIYSLLLSMLLMVVFYALLGWRTYTERERFIGSLRPFVVHPRLYDEILASERKQSGTREEEVNGPFQVLCTDILEASQACLVPLGVLAPLSSTPLIYPKESRILLQDLSEVVARLGSPSELGIPLPPNDYAGMVFALSLWSERGLIGILLLGEKQSGGLYTQEEIEIARAVGEHLMDTRASVEMARRLIGLQRQRITQSQILDQQTRRVVHDEILPLVHTSMLSLADSTGETGGEIPDTISLLEEIHRQLSDLLRATPVISAAKVSQLGLIRALRHTIDVELHGLFDEVTWEIHPEGVRKSEELPALVAEVLFFASREAVRNAARHGRQKDAGARLCLSIGLKYQNDLEITIEDNGAGFASGELGELSEVGSTAGSSGQGLALHSTMMAVIGGYLTVESVPRQRTRVTLKLPGSTWQDWA
jgi:signal transduction histidine kinase